MQLLGVTAETRSNEDPPHFPDHLEILTAVDHDGRDRGIHDRHDGVLLPDRPVEQWIEADSEESEPLAHLFSQPVPTLPDPAGEYQHVEAFK